MAPRIERIGDATPVAIYALCEWPSWEPRYVGKTIGYLHDRHKAHIRDAKRGRQLPVSRWLRKQLRNDRRLAIRLLEYTTSASWAERERWWILDLRARGANLLNLTLGGEGLAGHHFSASHRRKIAVALSSGGTFACQKCGRHFWRKASAIAKQQNKFCSRRCANARNLPRDLFDAA